MELTPATDEQWAQALRAQQETEKDRIASDAATARIQIATDERDRKAHRDFILKMTGVAGGVFILAVFIVIMYFAIDSDTDFDQKMNEQCVATGRTWNPAENTCTAEGGK